MFFFFKLPASRCVKYTGRWPSDGDDADGDDDDDEEEDDDDGFFISHEHNAETCFYLLYMVWQRSCNS